MSFFGFGNHKTHNDVQQQDLSSSTEKPVPGSADSRGAHARDPEPIDPGLAGAAGLDRFQSNAQPNPTELNTMEAPVVDGLVTDAAQPGQPNPMPPVETQAPIVDPGSQPNLPQ